MSIIYSEPEFFGLETVGEVEWSGEEYTFDLTVVWRRLADGVFLYGADSGCSCPAPFEDQGVDDLKPVGTLAAFKAHLEQRAEAIRGDGYSCPPNELDATIAGLLERMHKAGAR